MLFQGENEYEVIVIFLYWWYTRKSGVDNSRPIVKKKDSMRKTTKCIYSYLLVFTWKLFDGL